MRVVGARKGMRSSVTNVQKALLRGIMAIKVIASALSRNRVDGSLSNQYYRRVLLFGRRRKGFHMPTVSLKERGVVVRGCVSSTPSIRMSLSLSSFGSGAETGVNEENVWLRLGSPE